MKNFLFGVFVALATMISSCGSKDDKTPEPPQKTVELIGAWQMESSTIDGKPKTVSECTLKETIVFTEKTMERLSFKKRGGNCSYEKQDPLTYTLLGNTFTTKDGTTTFTITEGKLVIEGVYTDVQGNKKPSTTTYKRITEKELTALRAMEYKAPDYKKQLIGAWQVESATLDGEKLELSECSLKDAVIFTESTVEELIFRKYDEYNCTYKKQEIKPYTISGTTITREGKTVTFTVTETKFEINGTGLDEQGRKRSFSYTYKKITEKELTALRAMEYKVPEKTTDPKALIGAWQIEKATFNGQPIEKEPCEDKQVDIYTANTVTNYDFGFNNNTNRCEFEKGRAVPYTASNGTIIKKDDTPENFFVRGNRLVISFIDKNDDDNQGMYEYTFKKLTEAELAEINKLEKK